MCCRWWCVLLIGCVLLWPVAFPVQAAEHVVRAVLFYLSTCDHCRQVITHDLATLLDRYGPQLEIVGVDVGLPAGRELYQVAMQHFDVPEAQRGVPTLIVGNVVLIDSLQISQQFPDLIEEYLPLGCLGWPDIPGLSAALSAQPVLVRMVGTTSPGVTVAGCDLVAQTAPPDDTLSVWLVSDPLAGVLASAMLIGLVCGVTLVAKRRHRVVKSWPTALLAVLSLAASVYLASIETTHSTCICCLAGCREDAHWLNLISIGLLGAIGYALIATVCRLSRGTFSPLIALAWQALFGILAVVYLVLLEPLALGSRCIWCLTATVAATIVVWLIVPFGQPAGPKRLVISKRTGPLRLPITPP